MANMKEWQDQQVAQFQAQKAAKQNQRQQYKDQYTQSRNAMAAAAQRAGQPVGDVGRLSMEATPQASARATGPLAQFDALRKQAASRLGREADTERQRIQATSQGASQAMQRRFAANGMVNSGAAIKTQEKQGQELQDRQAELQKQVGQRSDEVNQGIDAQEMSERTRLNEAADQRDFQAQQAALGRNADREQFNLGMDARKMDMDFKQRVFAFDAQSKLAQMDQSNREFEVNLDTLEFNKRVARHEAEQNRSWWDKATGQNQVPNFD